MRKVIRRAPLWEITYGSPLEPAELISGWRIHQPFQEVPDVTLVCRAIKGNGNDGGYIALAIREGIEIDANYQSGPQRPKHGYGYTEGEQDRD